jgi:hypothetical protein
MKVTASNVVPKEYIPIKLEIILETEEELKVLRDLTWRSHSAIREAVAQRFKDTPSAKVYFDVLSPIYHKLAEYNNDNGTE